MSDKTLTDTELDALLETLDAEHARLAHRPGSLYVAAYTPEGDAAAAIRQLRRERDALKRIADNRRAQIDDMCSEIAEIFELPIDTPTATVISCRDLMRDAEHFRAKVAELEQDLSRAATGYSWHAEFQDALVDLAKHKQRIVELERERDAARRLSANVLKGELPPIDWTEYE